MLLHVLILRETFFAKHDVAHVFFPILSFICILLKLSYLLILNHTDNHNDDNFNENEMIMRITIFKIVMMMMMI